MDNKGLNEAKQAKKDEFYTQLCDIEAELKHYTDHFKGKTVYCNCDDPYRSNFFKYFVINFNELKLRKLICTCYDGNPVNHRTKQLFDYRLISKSDRKAYKIEVTSVDNCVTSDMSNSELISHLDGKPEIMKSNGDFRSAECIELLKQSDIVVTNIPFSLFNEYIAQMIQYEKLFLIIGNINGVTNADIFPYIKEGKIWLGASIHSGDREFQVPEDYPLEASIFRVDSNGTKYIRVKGVRWFTNIEYPNRHIQLKLSKTYSAEEYQKFDIYDAINVCHTCDIPKDYDGIMGVPITFLDKYSPDQFEIVGEFHHGSDNQYDLAMPLIHGVSTFPRIAIRRKQ